MQLLLAEKRRKVQFTEISGSCCQFTLLQQVPKSQYAWGARGGTNPNRPPQSRIGLGSVAGLQATGPNRSLAARVDLGHSRLPDGPATGHRLLTGAQPPRVEPLPSAQIVATLTAASIVRSTKAPPRGDSSVSQSAVAELLGSAARRSEMDEEEENVVPFRRTSTRTRRMATRMASALASSDNRAQAALARLEALESDNAGLEVVDLNDDEYGSTDEEDHVLMQKKQSKNMKRKTRQGKALEKRAARSFVDVLQEANLESLPPHVPTYLTAAVGPPSTSSRRHYCSVCGNSANYTCVRCGTRFCSCRCQVIHNDTRCLKFVA